MVTNSNSFPATEEEREAVKDGLACGLMLQFTDNELKKQREVKMLDRYTGKWILTYYVGDNRFLLGRSFPLDRCNLNEAVEVATFVNLTRKAMVHKLFGD